jgi:hypothetical protein
MDFLQKMKAKSLKRKTHKKRGVTDKDPIIVEASLSQLTFIGTLLDSSILSVEKTKEIEDLLDTKLSEGQATELIEFLNENQRDNINGGWNYTQGDIQRKLSELK